MLLMDSDRNGKYAESIRIAIETFRNREGRPPIVLDAGAGTGYLTACALNYGAHHVISVDVNEDHLLQLAHRVRPHQSRVTAISTREYMGNPSLVWKQCHVDAADDVPSSSLLPFLLPRARKIRVGGGTYVLLSKDAHALVRDTTAPVCPYYKQRGQQGEEEVR